MDRAKRAKRKLPNAHSVAARGSLCSHLKDTITCICSALIAIRVIAQRESRAANLKNKIKPMMSNDELAVVDRVLAATGRLEQNVKALEDQAGRVAEMVQRLQAANKLTLLFHSGGTWDLEKHAQWLHFVGIAHSPNDPGEEAAQATTKNLCDAVRAALAFRE